MLPKPDQRHRTFHLTKIPSRRVDPAKRLHHLRPEVDRLSGQTNKAHTQSVEKDPMAAASQANCALIDDHGVPLG